MYICMYSLPVSMCTGTLGILEYFTFFPIERTACTRLLGNVYIYLVATYTRCIFLFYSSCVIVNKAMFICSVIGYEY